MKKLILLFFSMFFIAFAEPKFLKINDIDNSLIVLTINCDQVIHDPYQVKCYSYKRKSPWFNMYYLDSRVNKSIKKRLSFKEDKRIPEEYQNFLKCYYKNPQKQDRGHLLADATADFNLTVLKTTYLTSNIVPEYYKTNRYAIAKVEKMIRSIANNHKLIVITGVLGNQGRLKNDKNCAVIPEIIYKIVFIKENKKWAFLKIYYFKNGENKINVTSKKSDLIKFEKKAKILILNFRF